MTTAIFLSHLIGDYLLQWNGLAVWKSREQRGVLVHGLIVTIVTLIFSIPFDTRWWPWAIAIGLTHTAIDGAQLVLTSRWPQIRDGAGALIIFSVDQALHLFLITVALIMSGHLSPQAWAAELLSTLTSYPFLTYLLAYAFIMMPTWVLVKFIVHGLIRGGAPDFAQGANKYVEIVERLLITTFVVLGQFLLVPLAALPRLLLERQERLCSENRLCLAELAVSATIAIMVGVGLRFL